MKLFKILFSFIFLLFPQYSFAQQTNTQLLSLIQSLLPTNDNNEISAADLRTVLANMVNSTNVTNTACLTASLSNYQFFADNAVPASVLIQLYDGSQCVTVGTLNTVSHTFTVAASTNNITVGTTIVSGGINGQCLYDNAGVVGNQVCSTGGTGTVTSVGIGTGLSSTQSPITTNGILSITNTSVIPNSYGSSTSIPTFTVNQQGQLTFASTNAVIAPAGTLTGSVLANNVLTSSLTSVGTLVGGATSAGFIINLTSSTISGTIPSANLPLGTTSVFGAVKCDGSTITCSSGVISSIGGAATSIVVGTTTIGSSTNGNVLYNNAGVLGDLPVTGTGNVAFSLSPTLTTPVLGTPTSVTLTNGTGLPISTGVSGLATGIATFLGTPSSANLHAALTDGTGTGVNVFATSPTLVTPILGVATVTSLNGNIFTTGTYTLTGTAAKTLNFNNTITLAGTDSTTWTGAASNMTLAALNLTGQTLSGGANVTSFSIGTPTNGSTTTISCGNGPLQFFTNNVAGLIIAAPANDGSCMLYDLNGASAGTITFSGFTVGSSTGDALTTTNTNKFFISIARINSIATYVIKALQ